MAEEETHRKKGLDLRRLQLDEAQETLDAIRRNEVDAVIVEGADGPQVYTLRSADQPYRMLVEQMQDGALMLTPGGDVVYSNARFGELAGMPVERVLGGSLDRFIVGDDRDIVAAMLRAGRGKHEGWLKAEDGRRIPVLLSVSTFVSDGVSCLCLVVTDLGELTRTRAARAEAEAANRAKDEFIAMLGHELRNPLGAISSAVSVLQQTGGEGDHAAHAHEVIARQTEQLTRVVEDLMDVSRVSLGKISLVREPIDLAEAVKRVVGMLADTGKLERHSLTVTAGSVWIDADASRFEQIVMNLVANALKYTPSGGAIRITIGREGDDAVLRVADSGVGIAIDLLQKIFDAFVQGDRGIARDRGGIGVGLTLVQRLVELHGGRVEAESAGPGQGSVFIVRLPAIAVPAERLAEPAAAAAPARRRRILVIEDNRDNREMMRVMLEMSGHEVHVAEEGLGGLELAARLDPEVVLVDLGLPRIDGYEVARRVRATAQGRHILLIALTGYGQPQDRQSALAAGFDDHLVKPVEATRLSAILAAAHKPV